MQRHPFTRGWQYRLKSNPFAELVGAAPAWQDVTLPHDATIGRERGPEHGGASGYTPSGWYEYRATLAVPTEWRERRVLLEFEGVYRSAMVYVNGALAARQSSGYTSFVVPLDDFLKPGQDNEIRVECRNHRDSRWYAGAGIHRPVHVVVGPLVHIAPDGVRIATPGADRELAAVDVATTVENHARGIRTSLVVTELRDSAGTVVAQDRVPVSVAPGEPAVVRQRMHVHAPELWGPDSPTLYTAEVSLLDGDEQVDRHDPVPFGIRTVQVDPHRGLRINGEPVQLRGACIHSDNGLLGAAAIDRADERRVEVLRAAGFNALRSAHNPMSRAMLDACDRLGVLVMDELTDMWTESKTDFDTALTFTDDWERDLASMISKDVNHPSVIMYSIGNEIPEVGSPAGALWSRRLAEKVRHLDPTRLVTNGVNGSLSVPFDGSALPSASDGAGINTLLASLPEIMAGVAASDRVSDATAETFGVLDVAGMNYMDSRYQDDRARFPNRVIVGSETFASNIDRLWRHVRDEPHVIGDFTWTGWDYLGEAGIGRVSSAEDAGAFQLAGPWPWLTAWCGDIDITGHRRPASYYREIVFGLRTDPYIAVERPDRHGREQRRTPWSWTDAVGSWAWSGSDGRPVTVEVYSDADEVELLLDGVSLGSAAAGEVVRYRAQFEVTIAAGELTAVARTGGVETGRTTLRPASGTVRLASTSDRDVIRADDTDLAFVDLALVDAAGTVVLGSDREVRVTVDGPAMLQGLGSAAPATEESYVDDVTTTFDGRALAVIRPHAPGDVTVTAVAEGMEPVSVRLRVD